MSSLARAAAGTPFDGGSTPLGSAAAGADERPVGAFGVCTIVFGLSRSVVLSLAALFVLGSGDMLYLSVGQSLQRVHGPAEELAEDDAGRHAERNPERQITLEESETFACGHTRLTESVPGIVSMNARIWSRTRR